MARWAVFPVLGVGEIEVEGSFTLLSFCSSSFSTVVVEGGSVFPEDWGRWLLFLTAVCFVVSAKLDCLGEGVFSFPWWPRCSDLVSLFGSSVSV